MSRPIGGYVVALFIAGLTAAIPLVVKESLSNGEILATILFLTLMPLTFYLMGKWSIRENREVREHRERLRENRWGRYWAGRIARAIPVFGILAAGYIDVTILGAPLGREVVLVVGLLAIFSMISVTISSVLATLSSILS